MTSPRKYDLRALLAEGRQLADTPPPASPDEAPAPSWEEARAVGADDGPEHPPGTVRRGRQTLTLQATWIDPEETPFVPVPRPGKAVPARLFSLLVLAAIVGLLAWLIIPEVSFRFANVDTVVLERGVLTAQPVPLAPTELATVEELYVDAGALPDGVLPAGTPVARLRAAGPDASGSTTIRLVVPFDARFVSVDALEGAVTLPGTPVATVYDPLQMYVIVTVNPDTLDTLRRGMRARLQSSVLDGSVNGTVISAVPLLGTDQDPARTDMVNVRIQPDEDQLMDLVPGIRFDATVDLDSAPEGSQPLVFTDADDAPRDGG